MPLFSPRRPRLNRLLPGSALVLSLAGAPASLHAQQPHATLVSASPSPIELASLTWMPPTSALTAPSRAIIAAPIRSDLRETLPADLPSDLPDSPGSALDPDSQQTSSSSSAPVPQVSTNPDRVSPNGTQQTKRVLGLVPNFRSVSADTKLPPMSAKDKFLIAGHDTFDYSSFFIAGTQAFVSFGSASYPEFHQGVVGFGRYYWHTLADTSGENFFVGGLGPAVFRQDNRFYTLGHGGFRKRTFYAVTRVLVSRKDDGSPTPNFAEVIGSGAASGLSTLYYPKVYQTWTKVGQKWLTSDIIDGFNFFWKEWWPDANKHVFHTQ